MKFIGFILLEPFRTPLTQQQPSTSTEIISTDPKTLMKTLENARQLVKLTYNNFQLQTLQHAKGL